MFPWMWDWTRYGGSKNKSMDGKWYRDDFNDIFEIDAMIARWRADQKRLHPERK